LEINVALSRAKFNNYKPSKSNIRMYELAADAVIYRGALVSIDAAGYLIPAADTVNTYVAGVAKDNVDNTGGDAGDVSAPVDVGGGLLLMKHAYLTGFGTDDLEQSDVGTAVVVSDDETVDFVGNTDQDIPVGVIDEIVTDGDPDDATVWVKLRGFGRIS
jgi:hypothetical protein